jgi:CRP/FNR family transcriptional regulator, cyclic AMP receptor protein
VGICSLLLTRTWVLDDLQHFRKLGFIEYKGRIQVHKSLLNVILHNQVLEQNALGASLLGPSRG